MDRRVLTLIIAVGLTVALVAGHPDRPRRQLEQRRRRAHRPLRQALDRAARRTAPEGAGQARHRQGQGGRGEDRRHGQAAVRRSRLRDRQGVRRHLGPWPALHLQARLGRGDPRVATGHPGDAGRGAARADHPAEPRLWRPGLAAGDPPERDPDLRDRPAQRELGHNRSFAESAPDEVGGGNLFLTGPPLEFVPPELQGKLACAVLVTYIGPEAEAREVSACSTTPAA